jgi:hypothetical protein
VRLGYQRVETQHDIGISRIDNNNNDAVNTLMLGPYLYFRGDNAETVSRILMKSNFQSVYEL